MNFKKAMELTKDCAKSISFAPDVRNKEYVVAHDLNEIPPSDFTGRSIQFSFGFDSNMEARYFCYIKNKEQNEEVQKRFSKREWVQEWNEKFAEEKHNKREQEVN